MSQQFIVVISVIATGLVAGVFLAVAVSVMPALTAMAPGPYVTAHRLLGRGYHPVMPLLVTTALLSDVALAAVTAAGSVRALAIVGAALLVGVQLVSQFRNVPINRVVHATDPEAIGAEWADPRPAWRSWHLLRTGLAIAALASIAPAAVLIA
jgi:uncharacterized membrane protein